MGRFLYIVFAPTIALFGLLVAFGRWFWVPLLVLGVAWTAIALLRASNRGIDARSGGFNGRR